MQDKKHEGKEDLLFHSFMLNPDIKFGTQLENEKIILLLRAHPLTQFSWFFNAFFMFVFLAIINFFISSVITLAEIIFIDLFGLSLILSYMWFNYLAWFYTVGIVTKRRIVDIDHHGLFYKKTTAAKLNRIEDITSKRIGSLSSIFKFGDINVQTAGNELNVQFLRIPYLQRSVSIINSLLPKRNELRGFIRP